VTSIGMFAKMQRCALWLCKATVAVVLVGCMPSPAVWLEGAGQHPELAPSYGERHVVSAQRFQRSRLERLRGDVERIRLVDFEYVQAEQEREDLCWAAGVQMLFRFSGISEPTQCEIARGLHGDVLEGPGAEERFGSGDCVLPRGGSLAASAGRIQRALRSPRLRYSCRAPKLCVVNPFTVCWGSLQDGRGLVRALRAGRPVLVGLRGGDGGVGHVVVVTGATYYEVPDEELRGCRQNEWVGTRQWGMCWPIPLFYQLQTYDPWPGTGGPLWVDADLLLDRIDFMLEVRGTAPGWRGYC